MPKSSFFTGIAIVMAVLGLVVVATIAAEAPETVKIEKCGEKQPAVTFSHAKHVGLAECSKCHHTQPDLTAESGEAQPCHACHSKPEDPATPSCSEMSMSKNPFHKNCLGCHKDAVKADESVAAPTKCAGCHLKG